MAEITADPDEIVKADALDASDRKESGVSGDSTSKEIDDLSAETAYAESDEESELNVIYSVMMVPTMAKES